MRQTNRLINYQKQKLPAHECRHNVMEIPDDEVLPSPPEGLARVLCPEPGCLRPLFIDERAPWVEVERVPVGQHPFDLNPPFRYTGTNLADAWWHRRCSNSDRWHHTTDMCDQANVQRKCGLCHRFRHDFSECPLLSMFKIRYGRPINYRNKVRLIVLIWYK